MGTVKWEMGVLETEMDLWWAELGFTLGECVNTEVARGIWRLELGLNYR